MRFLILFVLIFGLAACNSSQPQEKPAMAGVDLGRLMRDSEAGKEGMKFIEAQQKELQDQLDALQDKIEQKPNDEALMAELQQLYGAAQQKIQAEGQNIASQILDLIQRTLDSYRDKNGYEIILGNDALVSYSPKLDVTEAVLKEVNAQKINFTSLTQQTQQLQKAPEAAKEAEKEAPAEATPEKPAEQAK